nr:MAG TPA: hypothetical protein [Caudoviricetes sp.]
MKSSARAGEMAREVVSPTAKPLLLSGRKDQK